MEISARLLKIVEMVPPCAGVVDIGTDHGYVPIALLQQGKVRMAIASDNKSGPLERAENNARIQGILGMECRLGSGFETVATGEVEGAVLAGMGGILIRNLMESSMDIVKSLKFLLLQPAQNPEILRAYLYQGPFDILGEDLVKEEQRYYEYLLVRYNPMAQAISPTLSYRVGTLLAQEGHPQLRDFLESKMIEFTKIREKIEVTSQGAKSRLEEVQRMILELEAMMK